MTGPTDRGYRTGVSLRRIADYSFVGGKASRHPRHGVITLAFLEGTKRGPTNGGKRLETAIAVDHSIRTPAPDPTMQPRLSGSSGLKKISSRRDADGPMLRRGSEDCPQESHRYMNDAARVSKTIVNLFAATLAVQAPGAEVLAVICEQVIAVLTQPRASPCHGFDSGIGRTRIWLSPDRLPGGKACDVSFFHRPEMKRPREAGIVHDLGIAYINPVMVVTAAWRNEMCTEHRLFAKSDVAPVRHRGGTAALDGEVSHDWIPRGRLRSDRETDIQDGRR